MAEQQEIINNILNQWVELPQEESILEQVKPKGKNYQIKAKIEQDLASDHKKA